MAFPARLGGLRGLWRMCELRLKWEKKEATSARSLGREDSLCKGPEAGRTGDSIRGIRSAGPSRPWGLGEWISVYSKVVGAAGGCDTRRARL